MQNTQAIKKDKTIISLKAYYHVSISLFGTLFEWFMIIITNLLSLFIPQTCASANGGLHVCTIEDLIYTTNSYSQFVLSINFLTLIVYLCVLIAEYAREIYLNKNLIVNPVVVDVETFVEKIAAHPILVNKLSKISFFYSLLVKLLGISYFINILCTSVLIYKFNYLNPITAITILIYMKISLSKLQQIWKVAYNGLIGKLLSSYSMESKIFNSLKEELQLIPLEDAEKEMTATI